MRPLHTSAYPEYFKNGDGAKSASEKLENFAFLRYRKDGEQHAFTPSRFKPFHEAVRENDFEGQCKVFADAANKREKPIALRDLIEWKPLGPPVPLEQLEPVEMIFRRMATGAMSHGLLSFEAHEYLAIAMNRIGGRSNSGEDPRRFCRDDNGEWRNSAIKQIASARFGVTRGVLGVRQRVADQSGAGRKTRRRRAVARFCRVSVSAVIRCPARL